ncbi:hypothetical protein N7501_010249 [Penicillium viridicatum]|nr:hypothetical protein N7501_010249 [Penicillium viridicatum]
MHGIRQIRHCAVHRVPASAVTIAKYATMVKNVLLISRRLGGTEFENEYGGSLDQFLNTLWDIKGHNIPQPASAQPQPESFQGRYYNPIEANTTNVQRMLELQNVALERKLENITRMVENIEIAQAQKSARRARLTQQNYEAEQRRIERAQRNQQEREKAEQRRIEKAQRNQQQRDEAEQRRIEKEKRNPSESDERADRESFPVCARDNHLAAKV